ncbi:MAG: hypothetical protein GY926_14090 [bacterium]|nr:hypothetical protein [bacterium]MCP4966349.1 hypothetical protein [bacterium]
MRKLSRAIITAAMAIVLVVPATSASAQECGTLRGFANLQIFEEPVGGLLGTGTAVVLFDGNLQFLTFDETGFVPTGPGTADVTHVWHFAEGDATFLEHSTSYPIGSTGLLRFRSTVDVTPGGNARYNGVFDQTSQNAWFAVRGNICVGA